MLSELRCRHALLLQGPMGPFFGRLAADLRNQGIEVTKVHFNSGDELFYRRPGSLRFRGGAGEWPGYLKNLLRERGIDAVLLFGDCRPLHRAAIPVAREAGAEVWVFEEGYLRPDFITLEREGVNGHSRLPKDADFYRREAARLPLASAPQPVGPTFARAALYASLYSIALTVGRPRYPRYRHHRPLNAFFQAAAWSRGGARKVWHLWSEREAEALVAGPLRGRYFFVPLQVHLDAQITHSSFRSIEDFLRRVVREFSESAALDCHLVVKHHPADRAYRDYSSLLRRLERRHNLGGRLHYLHDTHLPTLLKNACGTVTMNSTVGLSSLYHRTPVAVLGDAVYAFPEMTFSGPLADFFADPGEVDSALVAAYCRYLRAANQINGSFYRRLPGTLSQTGLRCESAENGSPEGGRRGGAPRLRLLK